MNKKIIFFDIDRTLYDPDTRSIPKSTIEALRILNEREDIEIAIQEKKGVRKIGIRMQIMYKVRIFRRVSSFPQ